MAGGTQKIVELQENGLKLTRHHLATKLLEVPLNIGSKLEKDKNLADQ